MHSTLLVYMLYRVCHISYFCFFLPIIFAENENNPRYFQTVWWMKTSKWPPSHQMLLGCLKSSKSSLHFILLTGVYYLPFILLWTDSNLENRLHWRTSRLYAMTSVLTYAHTYACTFFPVFFASLGCFLDICLPCLILTRGIKSRFSERVWETHPTLLCACVSLSGRHGSARPRGARGAAWRAGGSGRPGR